jgi:transposase InsO family protein
LPLSKGFNSILVIVDHFSKGVHLIAASESRSAEDFAWHFFDRFIRYHGLPDKIVSDRGSIFVSKFWKEVQRLLRITAAPSTAWHPRTDGQTERANQTFETFLRHFVSDRQDDWAHLLPIAELVFNTSISASTGFSPFFSQFSFHPRTNMFHKGSTVPAAELWLENLVSVQETLIDNIRAAKEYQKAYFDKRTREGPTYERGDWVWLLRRNIATTRPSTKLDFKRLGPFRVDLPMGNDVYRLILPKDLSRLHPVFHASLLLPFVDPKSFPGRIGSRAPRGPASLKTVFWDEQDVELILGYRSPSKGLHEYLVRWRGGLTADDSWERGGDFSPNLHPYMEKIHDEYGAEHIILPPEKVQRVLL